VTLCASLLLCVGLVSPVVPDLIVDAAQRYGANPAQMMRVARCESQYGTHWRTNHATNPHRGVFQFERFTWGEIAPQIGVSPDFDGAYDEPTNVGVASYAFAIGQSYRWGCK
jgi:hypothetical protein